MAQAARLEPHDRVLEIGTGSGYGAAVLGRSANQVYSVEIIPELAEQSRKILAQRQTLRVLKKTRNGLVEMEALPVRFVPMVGEPPDTGALNG